MKAELLKKRGPYGIFLTPETEEEKNFYDYLLSTGAKVVFTEGGMEIIPEKFYLVYVCAWCGKELGKKEVETPEEIGISHGMCEECYREVSKTLKEEKYAEA